METRLNQTNEYPGIDLFRLIAAVLVITIHTSPLLTLSQGADLILSHAIARIAVPFFFAASGFFLISRYRKDAKPLLRFEQKTLYVYLAAVLLYIPINVYSRYFTGPNLLPKLIRDLVFDGTIYHLWYLPASMIGAFLAWKLVKNGACGRAMLVSGILYLIGLLGDSYYGLAKSVPVLADGYRYLFQIMDYTRNGIFFAPLFFVLGGILADRGKSLTRLRSGIGFGISLVLVCVEAMLVHQFHLVRHDSMYVFLVPCVFFLLAFLKTFRGKRKRGFRTFALLLYLIHPLMILIVRQFSRKVLQSDILIENTLFHFLAVCLLSVLASYLLLVLIQAIRNQIPKTNGKERAWIEADLENLEHNVKEITKLMPEHCKLMAVVKTDAYGHGAFRIATHLDKLGVRAYAAATLEEAVELRKAGVRGEILILGYTSPERIRELRKYDLTQTVADLDHAERLNRKGRKVKVHIKVDTGMHRLGILWNHDEELLRVFQLENLQINGIFTHLSCADSREASDVGFTYCQIQRFYEAVDALKAQGIAVPKTHIQSSYGLLNYPELKCDYVRIGIALYGVLSSNLQDTERKPDLRPVLSVKARVTHLQEVKKGEAIGYGRLFRCSRDSRIATVSIGYGDGLPRSLFSQAPGVQINGETAPFAGRISMDQLMVDITDLDGVEVGTVATILCNDPDSELSAPAISDSAGTISNELLSRLGGRLAGR